MPFGPAAAWLQGLLYGSLDRTTRHRSPRYNEIDCHRTIRANLRHYQPEYRTIIPERLFGYGHRQAALHHVVLCVDQSGSMAASVVYAGVFDAVLASLRSVRIHVVVLDAAVVDLSGLPDDPVEMFFGTQLGGGTDIDRALAYCQGLIEHPHDTILVLVTDLYQGGNKQEMIRRAKALVDAGTQVVALLALSDRGAPACDRAMAAQLTGLGIPAFACTPDLFPELLAAAIQRRDIEAWAAAMDITVAY